MTMGLGHPFVLTGAAAVGDYVFCLMCIPDCDSSYRMHCEAKGLSDICLFDFYVVQFVFGCTAAEVCAAVVN